MPFATHLSWPYIILQETRRELNQAMSFSKLSLAMWATTWKRITSLKNSSAEKQSLGRNVFGKENIIKRSLFAQTTICKSVLLFLIFLLLLSPFPPEFLGGNLRSVSFVQRIPVQCLSSFDAREKKNTRQHDKNVPLMNWRTGRWKIVWNCVSK